MGVGGVIHYQLCSVFLTDSYHLVSLGKAGGKGLLDKDRFHTGAGGGDKFGRAAGFVVLVEGNERLAGNPVMRQQRTRMARVLTGDAVGALEDLDGAQREVSQIPDRGRE